MTRSQGPAGGVPTGARGATDRSSSAEPSAPPPARASAYIPPTAVPRESKYHTIDMQAVRLSPEIDPVRMRTQLSMRHVQVPSKLNHRSLTGLALLGVSIGVGGWLGARSEVNERSKVIELSQGAVALPTSQYGSAGSISEPRTGDAIPMRTAEAGTEQSIHVGWAATVTSKGGVGANVVPEGGAVAENAVVADSAASAGSTVIAGSAAPERTAVPPLREQHGFSSRRTSARPPGGPTLAGPDVSAGSVASGSANGTLGAVQQTSRAVVIVDKVRPPRDTAEPSPPETKVWVAPSDPKAWLK